MDASSPLTSQEMHETAEADATVRLRLLGTTDLHAHLLPYDYYADEGGRPYGLSRTATLIRGARAEAANSMLFDNGDALHGTPIGDVTCRDGSGWHRPNPVIAAMNQLRYDAASLGNHEFDFGLDWLSRTLSHARFPFSCANMQPAERGADYPFLAPYLLLRRQFRDEAGGVQDLTLGVIGLVPPRINSWDARRPSEGLRARDMVETARELVPRVRAAGADLVLLLAHTGIDTGPPHAMMENAALPLAAIEGVDAIMAGHSHGLFPQPGDAGEPDAASGGIDHGAGTLNGTPALMAGAWGAHLGMMDLTLTRRGGRWRVGAHRSRLRAVAPQSYPPAAPDAAVAGAARAAHALTLHHMRRSIGHSTQRLHSFLALVRPDASVAAINRMQTRILSRALVGTAHERLPVLGAMPAFKVGGRGGPHHFCDVPEGAISLRHAADLCPFPNRLCGLLVTGSELREWLERAAICFARQSAERPEAMLRDFDVPGHDFDVISGLTYRIALSEPARYDRRGALVAPHARRIRDLRHAGRKVAPDDRFVLATSTYRAEGGGAFVRAARGAVVHVAERLLRDQLAEEIGRTPLSAPEDYRRAWHFAAMPGNAVLLDTSPALRGDPGALTGLDADDLGQTPGGFLRLRVRL